MWLDQHRSFSEGAELPEPQRSIKKRKKGEPFFLAAKEYFNECSES